MIGLYRYKFHLTATGMVIMILVAIAQCGWEFVRP